MLQAKPVPAASPSCSGSLSHQAVRHVLVEFDVRSTGRSRVAAPPNIRRWRCRWRKASPMFGANLALLKTCSVSQVGEAVGNGPMPPVAEL